MKKITLLLLLSGLIYSSRAQIAKVELQNGGQPSNVKDIVIVFKMHFDIGYTDWAEGILQKYSGPMLKETLNSIDASYSFPKQEQFVWTVPSWPLKYMIEHCPSDLQPSLDRALKEGRITPHGLPITFETEASDYETLVRGLGYSDQIRKAAGRELARDAKLTDVPSHSHILPSLLKNAGIDILHIGCNAGSKSPDIPTLSMWEGPDRKQVLLFNWAEYYGSGVMPPKDWPHKTWLAMIHTHENTGAPSLEEVAAVLREAREKMPHARIHIGELKDFYDLLMKENPQLPIIKGDMPDSWIHGYSSNPAATKLNRQMHKLTYTTETLNNLLRNWGISYPRHEQEFTTAIENQILYDEHTFGVAMSHGNQQFWSYGDRFQINKSLGEYDYSKTSWKEKQSRAETAERIIKPILRNQMKSLVNNIAIEGKRVVVFNPEPWKRTDRVNLFLGAYQKNFTIYALRDVSTNEVVQAYNRDFLLSFDAKDIPPMGYKTYEVITSDPKLKNEVILDSLKHTIENRYFKIAVNPIDGSLSSVFDKMERKELVDTKSEFTFAGMVHEIYGQEDLDRYNRDYTRPGADWALPEMGRPYTPNQKKIVGKGKCSQLKYEQMGNGARISALCETDSTELPYIINYTLYGEESYVEITCGVNSKKPDPRPEGVWLSFPFAVKSPIHKVFRLGGVINPATDFIDYTSQHFYYTNGSIALVDKQGGGVALDNPDAPGISIDTTGLFRYSRKFVPQTGLIFTNLMNTQWGTNFTEWVEGAFHVTYRIRSFNSYQPDLALTRPAIEARSPLLGVFGDGKAGNLPLQQAGVEVSENGVYVTAFQQQKEGTLLRLWEQAGKSGSVVVTLPTGSNFKRAELCNLRGLKTGKSIKIQNQQFTVEVDANGPVTYLLSQ